MSDVLRPELDAKYAKLWNQTAGWEIPEGLEPFKMDGGLSPREQDIYTEGLWKVLDLMANDGLVTRAALRRAHDEKNGWEPGRSKIHAGYVPPTGLTKPSEEAA
jgi:hypothetical protein